MKRLSLLILFLQGIILGSCGPSLQVRSDYDKRVDFSKYKTYELFNGTGNHISSLNQDRILQAVRQEMQKKGFSEDSVHPDLLVNTSAIVKTGTEVSANTNYYGYGGAGRPYYWNTGMSSSTTTYDVTHYKEGSLIIDVVDASTKKLVWQGVGDSRIDQSTKDADSRISGALAKIMEDFPPGASGH
jgi:hypothetical protein